MVYYMFLGNCNFVCCSFVNGVEQIYRHDGISLYS